MKLVNNARSILKTNIESDSSSFLVQDWEWALFKYEIAWEVTNEFVAWAEEIENDVVIKREPIRVKRAWDVFTIIERKCQDCVWDDSASPKVRWKNKYNFIAWVTQVSIYMNEDDVDEVNANTAFKDQVKWWVAKLNAWVDVLEVKKDDDSLAEVKALSFEWDWSKLTWIDIALTSTQNKYMLWSAWVVWKFFSLEKYEQLDYSSEVSLWTTTQPQVAQSFFWQPSYTWNTLPLMVRTEWSPDDWVYIEIQTDNAWSPSWTVVTNWTSNTVLYSSIAWTLWEIDFVFDDWLVPIEDWVLYHIVGKRTGANSDVNYYVLWSAWSDVQIWTLSTYNWSAWASQTDDLYFKLSWYHLAKIWWSNCIWVCQSALAIWQNAVFNKEYDNNQTWLVKWTYYWYNTSTWNLEAWTDIKAISENEITFDISNIPRLAPYISIWEIFWDWSDWDLYIANWQTVNLDTWVDYKFNSITIEAWWVLSSTSTSWEMTLRVMWSVVNDWLINLAWILDSASAETYSSKPYLSSVARWWSWAWWAGWKWWEWWNGDWGWWTWWAWSALWYWWGWGWWEWSDNTSWTASGWWRNGWAGWTPGWLGWAWWYYTWAWTAWWTSAWWGWGWWYLNQYWWDWWDAYSSIWNNWWTYSSYGWWGWGWAGWEPWKSWITLFMYVYWTFTWSWSIDCSWEDWTAWGNWWNGWWTSSWGWGWGWGWWGWWAGWFWLLINQLVAPSITPTMTWWAWWVWWTRGSNWSSWSKNADWVAWTSWGAWTSQIVLLKDLFF